MAFDKLIDALNEFRGEYVKELNLSLAGGSSAGSEGQGQGHTASGKLGESLRLAVQPKVKVFGQIYRMQITMEGYGLILDKGRNPGGDPKKIRNAIAMNWLKYPNVLSRLMGSDQQLEDGHRWALATVIGRNIAKKGYKGKKWIQPATDKMIPQAAKIVEKAIAEDIEITFEEIKKLIETK
jgi:hypothetical protein